MTESDETSGTRRGTIECRLPPSSGSAIRREPWIFALSTVGSVLFGALTVADAWVLGWATDHVVLPAFENGEIGTDLLVAVFALFLGVALLRAVGIVARRLGAGVMQYRMQAHTRRAVTRQYLALPMEWHQRHPTGQLLSNANSDVEAAWGPIAPLPMAVGTVAMMVIAVVQMFFADVVLALVGAAGLPGRRARQPRLPAPRLAADDQGPAAARRAQRGRPRVLRRRDGGQDPRPRDRGDRPVRRAWPTGCATSTSAPAGSAPRSTRPWPRCRTSACSSCSPSASRGCSSGATDARRRRHRRLPAHDRLLPDPLDRLAARRVPAQRRRLPAGSARCCGATGEMPYGERTVGRPGDQGARLEVEHLGYRYDPEQRLLDDVTFTVEPGRTVALVGATASGKSTLTTLMTRLVDPDEGRVLLDGTDLRDLARGELARRSWRRAADGVPLRRHRPRQRHARCRRLRRGRLGGAARRAGRRLRRRAAARARQPSSASAARRCPAASASGSRWPARWSASRGC